MKEPVSERPKNPSPPSLSDSNLFANQPDNHNFISVPNTITRDPCNQNYLNIEQSKHYNQTNSLVTTTLVGVSQVHRSEESLIFDLSEPTAHLWLMGDVQYVTDFLDSWSFMSCMLPLKLLNALLRSYGAPVLTNNPISGFLIALAIGTTSPTALSWTVLAALQGFLLCLLLIHSQQTVSSGHPTQHAILLSLIGCSNHNYLSVSILSEAFVYTTACALR